MSESLEDVVRQLRNFRRRTEAIQQLVDAGEAAVEPLLAALADERNTGAKWAMINVLGEIGDERAIPGVAPCLRETDFRQVAHEALVKITGQDCGDTPEGWLARHKKSGTADAPAAAKPAPVRSEPSAPLPFGQLLDLALKNEDATVTREGEDNFSVSVSLSDGRTQRIRVASGKRDHENSPIAIIYTECGPAEPKLYETVLRKNLQMPYGAVAIRDVNDRPCFVMFNSLLLEGLSPAALRKSIMVLAERGDKIEKVILKGEDKY